MSIFKSPDRTNFFGEIGFPFWDAPCEVDGKEVLSPYAMYMCDKHSPQMIKEIQNASVAVAEVFDKVEKEIKAWDEKKLAEWRFDIAYEPLLKADWDTFFAMRVGWGWKDGQLKFFEINSQTPSFWFEPETFNGLVAEHFGYRNPSPKSESYLEKSLNQAIKTSLKMIPTKTNKRPLIGFVTCNYYEDIHVMNWLASFCEFNFEVLIIDTLDFTKEDNMPFNRATNHKLDAVVFWYPIEWLLDLKFKNGEAVWDIFVDSVKQKKLILVHALPAFFIQSKSILAYITRYADRIFTGNLKEAEKYFPKTYLYSKPLGTSYFAKPIWGREGRGSYLLNNGEQTNSRYQESYYIKQQKVYQELLDLPQIKLEEKNLHLIYECWVYRVGDKFKPGAVGIRASDHFITDDNCYWLPIGV